MTDPQHEETFADTERKLREIITTLRAQLAEATKLAAAGNLIALELRVTEGLVDEQRHRADRAEAALAAQIEADAEIADSHDYGFMSMTDADMRAVTIAHAIRNQPHDRTALDRMLAEVKAEALQGPWSDKPDDLTDAVHKAHPMFTKKYDTYTHALELVSNRHSKGALVGLVNYLLVQSSEAREKALREAAAACIAVSVDPLTKAGREHASWMKATAEDCSRAILALIEKPNAR